MNPQNQILTSSISRRDFLSNSGKLATSGALAGVALPMVHGQSSDVTKLALVGCGGRGTGAASNALSVSAANGPTKLVAMADVFQSKLDRSYNGLVNKHKEQVDVPEDRRFIGFDSYQNAMDALDPGDVVIFTSPCAFRWVHFQYAIKRGLNVFMEKPVTPDGFSSRKMLELNEEAKKLNLKVGVGLMCRHSQARRELKARIEDGELGDILSMRAYRMQGPIASCFSEKKPADESELMYQIRRFHSFLWLSGGSFSDFFIHNIDECCWMKGMWPVRCHAQGGRHYRGNNIDQISTIIPWNTHSRMNQALLSGRNMAGCKQSSPVMLMNKGLCSYFRARWTPISSPNPKGQGSDSDLAWMFGQREGHAQR